MDHEKVDLLVCEWAELTVVFVVVLMVGVRENYLVQSKEFFSADHWV